MRTLKVMGPVVVLAGVLLFLAASQVRDSHRPPAGQGRILQNHLQLSGPCDSNAAAAKSEVPLHPHETLDMDATRDLETSRPTS